MFLVMLEEIMHLSRGGCEFLTCVPALGGSIVLVLPISFCVHTQNDWIKSQSLGDVTM